MKTTDVLIVGGGQAGLALSHCLTGRGVDHLVLERGRTAERWRSETPASLRLLTPNWMTRLPGRSYAGKDPDGFMTRDELVAFLTGYAASFGAPVVEGTTVLRASASGTGFRVNTDRGDYACRVLVVATGHCDLPRHPPASKRIGASVHQVHSSRYRSPDELPDGGVLVVGASSSGVQIADELARSGRRVVLSVGRHIRLPRTYRGRDVFWWMDRAGILDQKIEDLPDPAAALRQPSMQLVGRPDRRDLDLQTLGRAGVELAGRLAHADRDTIFFADDLAATTLHADSKLRGLLTRFDRVGGELPEGPRPDPILVSGGLGSLSLRSAGVGSIVWATGYSRRFDWLDLPAKKADGDLDHRGGITTVPGLYALGFRMLRRRNSSFIDGVGADALALGLHIDGFLAAARRRAA